MRLWPVLVLAGARDARAPANAAVRARHVRDRRARHRRGEHVRLRDQVRRLIAAPRLTLDARDASRRRSPRASSICTPGTIDLYALGPG